MSKKDSGLLPLLIGVSTLGIALVLGGVYVFSRYVLKQANEAGQSLPGRPRTAKPSIETVERGTMYPGAVRVEDSPEKIDVDLPAQGSYQVVTGSYITHDTLEEAIAYYRHFFNNRATERLEPGGARWVWKTDRDVCVVVLRQDSKDRDRLNIHLAVIFEED